VCSHGWGGARCEVDLVPSCDRDATFACHNVVLGVVLVRSGATSSNAVEPSFLDLHSIL